jgi:hypothetical protein
MKMKENDEVKVDPTDTKLSPSNLIKDTALSENNLLNREPKRYKVKSKTELITLENEEASNEPVKQETKKLINITASSTTTTSTNNTTGASKALSDNDVDNNANNSTGLGVGMSIQER